ncbi:MAG TPA: protein kinase, partial [Thermoanaerobaculia bacterium]|nr:protein kinase [Thermoanaerobaculia bacterium]
ISSGTRLGPYEIVAPLGAGGMGEVYRARDTRLDRTVAIKVLPQAFASNANLKQRFEREARVISQLSHPNICTMHDVGAQDGVDYIVMEYLEGETLADRLTKGPLPLDKAIRYAIEIADALDKAHRQGIVHRDLKPANVMLTRSGAKLLDFGLAKPAAPAVDGDAATMQKSLTAEGTIIGTFQYMAPEQLEGMNADARTDIFAFGALLYEMLTGKRAFEGKTRTSVIAAIVEREPPPISQFQPLTPPPLERLVRHCLAKDPDERWQTAHDLLLELRGVAESGSSAAIPAPLAARRRGRERVAWIVAALAAVAAIAAGLAAWRMRRAPEEVLRTSIVAPAETRISSSGDASAGVTISPDGKYVTFVGPANGVSRLWVRRVDQWSAQPLAGTDDAAYPFWSPDSKEIGFFANRQLKRIPAAGGAVVTITRDVRDSRGATWGANDVIVYSHHWRSPLYRISANGGNATAVTKLDESRRETTHRYPRFLPDGEHFLYLAGSHTAEATSGENAIFVGSVRAGEQPKLLLRARSNAAYAAGHLLFWRDGKLLAQRFDLDALALEGEPRVIADDVRYEKGFFRAIFDVSNEGTLVLVRGATQSISELVWFDRSGKRLGTVGEPDDFFDVRISPDGNQALVAVGDPADLWAYDLRRNVRTRITFGAFNEQTPVYAPDGKSVLYANDASTLYDTFRRSLTAGSAEAPFIAEKGLNEYPWDWGGGYVVYEREDLARATTLSDLWAMPENGGKPFPVVETPALDSGARISPDGRWLAYTSLESGRAEVYVTTFPRPTGKWQVSQGGGGSPTWRGDGREIYYIDTDGILAVPVSSGATFDAGTPSLLFRTNIKILPPPFYDVTADGQRFLVNTMLFHGREEPITLVRNWQKELEEK